MVNSMKCELPSCPENAHFSAPSGDQRLVKLLIQNWIEFELGLSCGDVEACQCVENGVSTYVCSNNASNNATEATYNKYDNCPPSKCVCNQGYCATSTRNVIIF